jgi:hypothetical protein
MQQRKEGMNYCIWEEFCTGKGMRKKNAAQREILVPTELLLCVSNVFKAAVADNTR